MDKQLKDIVDSRLKVKYVCSHMLECVRALLWHHYGLMPSVQEYLENVMERERWSEQMMIKDPRTEEESIQASSLLNLVLVGIDMQTYTL